MNDMLKNMEGKRTVSNEMQGSCLEGAVSRTENKLVK